MLSFETPECKIEGGLDVYSTKQASSDRKLYKTLDKHLDNLQQDAIQYYSSAYGMAGQQSKSFSPPNPQIGFPAISSPPSSTSLSFSDRTKPGLVRRHKKTASIDSNSDDKLASVTAESIPGFSASFSDSPFGPLDQAASRKAFAHLIAILNYTHPDHDFSSLQPADFRRERSPTTVINSFNNLLFASGIPVPATMWECLDRHINLKESAVYSHSPPESFLDDEPGTLWCYMWFFFNRRRKRVAYLHLTAIRSHHSPTLGRDAFMNGGSGSGKERTTNGEEEYDLTIEGSESDYDVVGDLELE